MKAKNQKGFSVVEVLIVIVVIGLLAAVGWFVYKQNNDTASDKSTTQNGNQQKEETKEADPYEGWAVCNDTSQNLSFKYPANWSTQGTTKDNTCGINMTSGSSDGASVTLSSPSASEKLFRLRYSQSSSNGIYSAESGQLVRKVIKLPANSSKQLYVVFFADAYSAATADKVTSMALTDVAYSEGEKVDKVVGVRSTTQSGKYIQLSANLRIAGEDHQLGQETIAQYESNPEYNNVLNLFKSFTLE